MCAMAMLGTAARCCISGKPCTCMLLDMELGMCMGACMRAGEW